MGGTTRARARRAAALPALALGLLASPAAGQVVEINELRPLLPNATVEIDVVTHSLSIEGWDRDEIQVIGELDLSTDEIEIDGDETVFRLEIEREDRGRQEIVPRRLEIRVPRAVRFNAESVTGAVDVASLSGRVEASSVLGRVEVRGDLTLAEFQSVTGAVIYTGSAPTVQLESVSGDVRFEGEAETVQIQSLSGAVWINGAGREIEASTVMGRIDVTSATPVRMLELESVAGDVTYVGGLAEGGSIEVGSHSGQVDLTFTSSTDARFDLEVFSGDISAEVPGMRDEVGRLGRFTPNESLTFVTGSGTGSVTVESFSGSIRIR